MLFGGLLTALGVVAYTSPDLLGTGDSGKISALSPAFLGLPIALAGLVSTLKPSLLKHAMHVAAVLGLLGIVGGFVPVALRNFNFDTAAVKVGVLMTLLSVAFVALCVKSFIDAKKARKAREAATA
jgi:hypothetical protein